MIDVENSPSGLWRTLGKRVGVTASRVRISYSPRLGVLANMSGWNPFYIFAYASKYINIQAAKRLTQLLGNFCAEQPCKIEAILRFSALVTLRSYLYLTAICLAT